MLNEIKYEKLSEEMKNQIYGKGADLGMGMVATFGFVAIITIVMYKLFNSKTGEITLPGGYKFKFTT